VATGVAAICAEYLDEYEIAIVTGTHDTVTWFEFSVAWPVSPVQRLGAVLAVHPQGRGDGRVVMNGGQARESLAVLLGSKSDRLRLSRGGKPFLDSARLISRQREYVKVREREQSHALFVLRASC
jgi:hypothetical protein